MMMTENPLDKFMRDQLSVWPLAASNFRSLKTADVKEFKVYGMPVKVQRNPARIISSSADTAPEAIAARKCFLCVDNRPEEQYHMRFEGREGRAYHIQVNPYPIFPGHFVIARDSHVPQSIWHCYVDMLDFARKNPSSTIFYNGPACGASAPDHMHFQACPRHLLPLEEAVCSSMGGGTMTFLTDVRDARLYRFEGFSRGVFVLRATTSKSMEILFYRLLDCAPVHEGESEPRFNLFTWHESGEYRSMVVFRDKWRPHFYDAEGDEHYTMSLGCADVAGFFIVPVGDEFARITPSVLERMLDETSIPATAEDAMVRKLTRSQRTIDVGIMSAPEISFEIISDGAGARTVRNSGGRLDYNGTLYDELVFDAVTSSSLFAEPTFVLHGVTIGVDFHWQRQRTQKFAGTLIFVADGGNVTAINRVGVEDYLLSVISSEMKSTASPEFLKAHAVISRSWVMSQIGRRKSPDSAPPAPEDVASDTVVRWFDHDDHILFDVCADDHCQRYQGLGQGISANARKAVDETWGEVLTYGGQICDARFSKCCGGVTELFSTCWEDKDYPYLAVVEDVPGPGGEPFCNTADAGILAQVLNDYDLETRDFYRWSVRYSRDRLSALLRERSGIDFGTVEALEPVERGPSGRIKYLKITGSLRTLTVGKELLVRRWLSTSHLKSSAFDVSYEGDDIVLEGRGWGHGVGLCQIGAAVMASRGYDYKQILGHYYPGSQLELR